MNLNLDNLKQAFHDEGLPVAEDTLQLGTKIVCKWLKAEALALPLIGKLVIIPLVESFEAAALAAEDKIDGQIGV